MPYRILHFIDTLGAGGAERQLVYLLKNLNPEIFESHVLTTYDTFRHYEAELKHLNIPLYSLHHGELSAKNRVRASARYVRLMWHVQPKIVHSWLHYPNLIARLSRLVSPPHRLITAVRSEYSLRQQCSERITEVLSDFRIVNNKQQVFTKSHLSTTTIPNAIDPDQFLSKNNYPPSNRSSFTLLMVARIDPCKDHQTLLNALYQLREELPTSFKTILIGEVTDLRTQQQLEKTIDQCHLSKFVEQLPPTHNIAPHYQNADVIVLPSKTEAFTNVVLESFAAGKPIIVSDAANKNALVQHNINGWVFPTKDSFSLAHCIKESWQMTHEERALMGRQGQEIIRGYSVTQMVEHYSRLYELALNDS